MVCLDLFSSANQPTMRGSRIVLLAFAASASGLPTSGPKVASSYGTWYGKTFLEVDSFRGIPFAQPPVGELRFAPPLATKKNYGDFDATVRTFASRSPTQLIVLSRSPARAARR